MVNYDVMVRTQSTPNPNAIKFVVNCAIKAEGKATFENSEQAKALRLAEDLFAISGVEQLHMFENVVTVTHKDNIAKDDLVESVISVLKSRLPVHDPHFVLEGEKQKKKIKENLSPEIQAIEEILDRTIRPGLQADGGDIEVVDYKDNLVTVRYEGACGSCPSAMYGTLDAIYSILRAEFNPELDITIA
ncbi:MAG: NifU family protein [Bdellovibrionales bacterium]|nr:NifU family protein [Bdellovibrionales bacterium]